MAEGCDSSVIFAPRKGVVNRVDARALAGRVRGEYGPANEKRRTMSCASGLNVPDLAGDRLHDERSRLQPPARLEILCRPHTPLG
jgi:hypothetical protein